MKNINVIDTEYKNKLQKAKLKKGSVSWHIRLSLLKKILFS